MIKKSKASNPADKKPSSAHRKIVKSPKIVGAQVPKEELLHTVEVKIKSTGEMIYSFGSPSEEAASVIFNTLVRTGYITPVTHYGPDDLDIRYTSPSGAVVRFERFRG